MSSSDTVRLNKFLASCGVGSRRQCDTLIREGRVEINGSPVSELATRVGPDDHVRLDGKRMQARRQRVIAMHKPRGLVCSRDDELGRDTIYKLLAESMHDLHHVGRLDRDSEGLLILTNDGNLSQTLLHPSREIEKEYLVTINQAIEKAHLAQLTEGIYTEEGKLIAKEVERLSARRLKMVLKQGAKRQIRVMLKALGYQVQRLLRVRIGELWLGELECGQWADLTEEEIGMLLRKAHAPVSKRPGKKRPR
jgi:23S rRNA pseudouridine2605 synthase